MSNATAWLAARQPHIFEIDVCEHADAPVRAGGIRGRDWDEDMIAGLIGGDRVGAEAGLHLTDSGECARVDDAEVLERGLAKVVAVVARVVPDLVRAADVAQI